jgi:hypothetical protein
MKKLFLKYPKPAVIIVALLCITAIFGWLYRTGVFKAENAPMPLENIASFFPESIDQTHSPYVTLAFGYTFGPWPKQFLDQPIVMKLPYQKGPPDQFIPKMTAVFAPIDAELQIDGPRTALAPNSQKALSDIEWKVCFSSRFSCVGDKKAFHKTFYQDLSRWREGSKKDRLDYSWFESDDPRGARGVHVHYQNTSIAVDRYILLTESGSGQSFTLKTTRTEVGESAREVFQKILGGLRVSTDLSNARAWTREQLKQVSLAKVRRFTPLAVRLSELIRIQTLLYSQLSIDPTQADAFLHLAGVTHLFGMDILKTREKIWESQEAWTKEIQPTLRTLMRYVRDFSTDTTPNRDAIQKNIEALLQDVLLLEKRLSHGK